MASGHVTALTGRTYGCTDQQRVVKTLLANSEPSTHGTSAVWRIRWKSVPSMLTAELYGAPSMIMTWLCFDICYLITASLSAFVIRE